MSGAILDPISLRLAVADPLAFSGRLGRDFQRHGFAVISDHTLDAAHVQAALADAKTFFALPDEIKRRYRVVGAAGQRGYTPFGLETAKGASNADLKEFWHVGREGSGSGLANIWPSEAPRFRASTVWLYDALESLGAVILGGIARHLGLSPSHFEPAIEGGDSILRLLHYPAVHFDGAAVRAGAHEDINAITLLLGAEEAGLEILDREDGWRAINPPRGCIVVNIGDMLSRLTNNMLPSTTHRVVNPRGRRRATARYSMPFFLHFRADFSIRTLPGCITADRPDRFPHPITAGDFLKSRLAEIRLS
jgi:isopenicillin N synthase-like dioxygenase